MRGGEPRSIEQTPANGYCCAFDIDIEGLPLEGEMQSCREVGNYCN